MAKRWVISPPAADLNALAERWKLPPLLTQLLYNRGYTNHQENSPFLPVSLRDLQPPESLPGTQEAAALIAQAARDGKRIVLYGDYDVDGITGLAILWHVLTLAQADVSFYVPHRIEEGYGLNLQAARDLAERGAQVIVTVDCGITATDVAADLADRGVTLIVTDHHTPGNSLPAAAAIVHPRIGAGSANEHLCGAGVAFKLAWAIAKRLSRGERVSPAYRELLTEMLPLAALGTIADLVPLTGENRVIARHGLERLPRTRVAGLRALMKSAGLTGNKIDGYDVGFRLAPRINAAGRMGHARLAAELLTRADESRAREISLYLEDHNRKRQTLERKITAQACEWIERNNLAGDARRAIVLASPAWHAGVIGIVASRIVEQFHRPTVMIALGEKEGQGSARSVPHFDLTGALQQCGEHLLTYGGHAMAAGLRIAHDAVDAFTEAFVATANDRLTGMDLLPQLRLDAEVSLAELTLPTTRAIVDLGPFGVGNPKPRLASGWVSLWDEPRCVGRNGEHLQASFRENGTCMRGIGFGLGSLIEDLKQHRRCRVAFEPMVNEFRGATNVEMRILDLQFAT